MKKLLTLALGLFAPLLFSNLSAYAQKGKGGGGGQGSGVQRDVDRDVRINDHHKVNERKINDPRTKDAKDEEKHAEHERQHAAKEALKDERKHDKVFDHIQRNPALAERVRRLLPVGTNLQTASEGFKNEGQFIAALHVSRNLNIPFQQLKSKMTGTHPMSLGEAIHELRPNLADRTARREAERAEKEAKTTEKSVKTT